jgi:hypothetical protein
MLSVENYSVKKTLAFLLTFLSVFGTYSQPSLRDKQISVEIKNGNIIELLKQISDRSELHFSYNPRKLDTKQKITYQTVDKKLADILDELAITYNLKFEFLENQVIVKQEKKTERVEPRTATLSGTVTDSETGEALIGTTLAIKELQKGTTANAFGFYSLTVPKGKYEITYSFVGYKPVTSLIDLTSSLKQNISLSAETPVLEEVVINNVNATEVVTEIKSSTVHVRPATVEERPAFFGEMDVIKSLEAVPGIKMHSDGSTFYYVRGGNRDQNLILVDDAPIYNPSHILGIFSTIVPDVVNDINIYKGDMPASLGGRISSLLDVRTKKGNDQHFQFWGNTNIISTKLGVEGPIRKNASSYLLSARISKVKWFFQRVDDQIKEFQFHDLTGKINAKWGNKNRFYFSFYNGADYFVRANRGISWSNNAGTLRWNHLFNGKLFLNTTVCASGYDYFLHTDVEKDVKWNSHISNFNIKNDFSYFIKPENEFTFGLSLNGYAFNPGNLQANGKIPDRLTLSVRNSVEFVLYGNHELKVSDKLGLNYGLRLTNWANNGEAFEFIFDKNRNPIDTLYFKKGEKYKQFTNAEPRLTLNYQLNADASVKTSFSHNVQNIHLITNSVSPFTSLEVWLPSSYNIKPQKANQVTMGYYRAARWGTSISTEVFYKKMLNQIDYNPHAETLLNPLLEKELRFGKANAYGFELMGKKDEGRLRGWAGYSYSRAKRKFADINGGNTYNAFSDRPHQINLMAAYDLTLRWNIGMNWIYYTGSPYSAPISFYQYNGEEVPVYGQKNNARLPNYHRLDLSATFRLNKNPDNKVIHTLAFSIFNVYGRKNPLFINYNKSETAEGDLKISQDVVNPERVTSQFYLFRFAPSISYNFKWL